MTILEHAILAIRNKFREENFLSDILKNAVKDLIDFGIVDRSFFAQIQI
jgi:hypothetical protein